MENLIFGIMVAIAIGAGILTCIYEAGSSSRTDTDGQSGTEQNAEQNK